MDAHVVEMGETLVTGPDSDANGGACPRQRRTSCGQRVLHIGIKSMKAVLYPFAIAMGGMAGGWLAFSLVSQISPVKIDVHLAATLPDPGPY